MLKPGSKRVLFALCCGAFLLLAAAWSSGSYSEICEQTKAGQEHCTVHNLATFFLLETGRFLESSAVVVTALATIAIAWFTWTLWQSNEEMSCLTKGIADTQEKQMLIVATQTDIQKKQHFIGRLQFFATHRPRIVVRGVSLDEALVAGKRIRIRIPIVNQGNTDATIKTIAARAFLVTRLDQVNVGDQFHIIDTSGMVPLASGTHATVNVLTDIAFDTGQIFGMQQKTQFLLCVGYVQYRDESGGLRATGFMRCLQHESARFTPVDDSEYEFGF